MSQVARLPNLDLGKDIESDMNSALMEELLNEDESSVLDFKRDQYPFEKATDEQKSELLKDILALANAWRRTDAYILIGVEEVKGGRSNVVGVTSHLNDASIQQFVNSKTNRPVTFSYEVFPFEGVQLGVICLPLQDRPIYIKKDFGKLKQNEVYIRRSSSTDIANPDEVAKMGTVKIRDVLDGLPLPLKANPVVEALRLEQEQGNVVLVEKFMDRHNHFRQQCKVVEVNELYARFRHVQDDREVSGAISQITVSYEPAVKMKMFTIAPIV